MDLWKAGIAALTLCCACGGPAGQSAVSDKAADLVFPAALDFGAVQQPCTEAARSLCVANMGSTGLSVTGFALIGSSAFVAEVERADAPFADGGELCLELRYAPGAPGTHSASLTFEFTELPEPLIVELSGRAEFTAGQGPQPRLQCND